jgi:hypothetical protein
LLLIDALLLIIAGENMDRAVFPIKLNNPDLLRSQSYLNGQWVDAKDGALFAVDNPATGEHIAHVANLRNWPSMPPMQPFQLGERVPPKNALRFCVSGLT